MIILARW